MERCKVVKAVIKSNLGGNLRLRTPNAIKSSNGCIEKATGKNTNPFLSGCSKHPHQLFQQLQPFNTRIEANIACMIINNSRKNLHISN